MEFSAQKRFPCSVQIVHNNDQYDFIKDIGSGNFGVTRLMRYKQSNEQVAIKYIARGCSVSYYLSAHDACLRYPLSACRTGYWGVKLETICFSVIQLLNF